MTETILAVYEDGVLRPLEPLQLKERQTVYIQVLPQESVATDEREDTVRILVEAGLVRPRPGGPIPPDPLSKEERKALADRLGQAPGKTASEMVIEDRGER
jgi:predicted DNA-binding antitoxin AbrB/MazE fold protein